MHHKSPLDQVHQPSGFGAFELGQNPVSRALVLDLEIECMLLVASVGRLAEWRFLDPILELLPPNNS